MKISLSLDILKEIVEDGIQEMKSRMNFSKRQRVMKSEVLNKVFKYKDLLVVEFLPTLVSDFEESI